MLTSVTIRNFKRFEEVTIPLNDVVVFAGPNNSGKTTAIQALTLWHLAVRQWLAKRGANPNSKAKLRTGVPITRKDITNIPVRAANLLWHECRVMGPDNKPFVIELVVEGMTGTVTWRCGMELRYQSAEQIYCRPMRQSEEDDAALIIPTEAENLSVAHLQALSGLLRDEELMQEGAQDVRIGQGRAGEILRNLLYKVSSDHPEHWNELRNRIRNMFQVELLEPNYNPVDSQIVVEFRPVGASGNGVGKQPRFDLASGGSGFQQTLLCLAFLYARPSSVFMFDEPDAHLEIIRQEEIFTTLREVASNQNSQLIVASHSETILDRTDPNDIIAFLGNNPHRLSSSQARGKLKKSLNKFPSKDYLLAEQKGAVLYLEDYTDLEILRAWAKVLDHPASKPLETPFKRDIGNNLNDAREHFYCLREAYPSLRGVALIDFTEGVQVQPKPLQEMMWTRREIENYLLVPSAILRFCAQFFPKTNDQQTLFDAETRTLLANLIVPPVFTEPLSDLPFLMSVKGSDDVLDPFFRKFFQALGLYNEMPKKNFYRLAEIMLPEEIHPEVIEKLDIVAKHLSASA